MKVAEVPTPFAAPAVPFPTRVDTSPFLIIRTLLPALSVTYRTPAESTAIPVGALKDALKSGPSAVASVPLPAKVPTAIDVRLIERMRLDPLSARYTVPSGAVTPHRSGFPKRALVPIPSAYPDTPFVPKGVVTMPVE